MKRKMFFVLTVIAISVLSFTSCGKYEEGPSFSLRTKTARLVNTWKIEKMTIDGVEQSMTGTEDGITYTMTITVDIKKDNTYEQTMTVSAGAYTQSESATGVWEWGDSKETIKMKANKTADMTEEPIWEESKILKLKNDELWIQDTDENGKVSEAHLVTK